MSSSLPSLRSALHTFTSSASSFKVLRVIPDSGFQSSVKRLFVLDSSFNPPTRAHHRIISSALRTLGDSTPPRVLLLLATQNAEKAPKPAAFEERLDMMVAFAWDLLDDAQATPDHAGLGVDVGVTKLPYFVDKAAAIAQAPEYKPVEVSSSVVEQVHLVGYDTLIRILDTKYYPPHHTLDSLDGLFEHHSLRVTLRADDKLGNVDDQKDYVRRLSGEPPVAPGWRSEWASKINMDDSSGAEGTVSSTRARKAVADGDLQELESLCSPRIGDSIWKEGLYSEVGHDA